jgi:hypothetical protein
VALDHFTTSRVPAKRLRDVCALPESECSGKAGRGCVVRNWRLGVSAERRHLKKSGNICGGLPTRRYGAGARRGLIMLIPNSKFKILNLK